VIRHPATFLALLLVFAGLLLCGRLAVIVCTLSIGSVLHGAAR